MKFSNHKEVLAICFLSVVIVNPINAQDFRTLSIDTGYRTKSYSNRAIGNFGLEYIQATSLLFEGGANIGFVKNSPWSRGLWLALNIITNDFLSQPISQFYHEFGHGTRMAVYGIKPELHIGVSQSNHHYDNFFLIFLNDFGNASGASCWPSDDEKYSQLSRYQRAVEAAGGLNNEMYISELIRNTVYLHGGRVSYWSYTGEVNSPLIFM